MTVILYDCSDQNRKFRSNSVSSSFEGLPLDLAADQLQSGLQEQQARFHYLYTSSPDVRIHHLYTHIIKTCLHLTCVLYEC